MNGPTQPLQVPDRSQLQATAEVQYGARHALQHHPGLHYDSRRRGLDVYIDISLVPEDVLYLIFARLLVATEWVRKGACLRSIMSVCRRWTAVVTNMPQLWTELSSAWLTLTPAVLGRSDPLPLTLECVVPADRDLDVNAALRNICRPSNRLCSLTLCLGGMNQMEEAITLLEHAGPLPVLERLSMSVPESESAQQPFLPFPGQLLLSCGRLYSVILINFIFEKDDSAIAVGSLLHVWDLRVTLTATPLDILHVARLVSIFPSLVTLHYTSPKAIDSMFLNTPSEGKIAMLPSLERLTLVECRKSWVHYFANYLHLPENCTVQYIFHSRASLTYLVVYLPSPDRFVTAASIKQSTNGISGTFTMTGASPKTLIFTQMAEKDDANAMSAFHQGIFPDILEGFFTVPHASVLNSLTLSGPLISSVLAMMLGDCTDPGGPYLLPSLKELIISAAHGTSWLSFNLRETLECRHRGGLPTLDELNILTSLEDDLARVKEVELLETIVGRLTVTVCE